MFGLRSLPRRFGGLGYRKRESSRFATGDQSPRLRGCPVATPPESRATCGYRSATSGV